MSKTEGTSKMNQTPSEQSAGSLGVWALCRAALPGLVFGLIAGLSCYWVAGPTLGAWIGPLALVAAVGPLVVVAEEGLWRRLFAVAGIVDGLGAAWLWVMVRSPVELGQWLRCYLVLLGLAVALGGMVSLLHRARLPRAPAGGLVALVALGWLTWPIWTSPWLRGQKYEPLVERLSFAHPVLAVNVAVAPPLSQWVEDAFMYQQTALNQDVLYIAPRGVAWTVVVHLGVGVVLFGAAHWQARSREAPRPEGEGS